MGETTANKQFAAREATLEKLLRRPADARVNAAPEKRAHVVVLGAGSAGLGAAYQLLLGRARRGLSGIRLWGWWKERRRYIGNDFGMKLSRHGVLYTDRLSGDLTCGCDLGHSGIAL